MCAYSYHQDQEVPKELKDSLTAQQKELAAQILIQPLDTEVKLIAGCDSSFYKGDHILSVFVVLSYPELELVESHYHVSPVELPYIPGLLAFREMPNVLKAYELLENEPDLIVVDGHGISHPRKMGIATHIGIELDKPTIGVAKKRLVGKYDEPGPEKGEWTELVRAKKVIGRVLRNKKRTNPIFISPGHKITLEEAFDFVEKSTTKYRLPEPTRIADAHSKSYKKDVKL
ncbi:MAG: deoxyribonuclease V [Deltaproteobacteria bacterium]|nr:deoxyribonuclease V [Deltaproteobacteria bacterium]MBU54042.1 deoxyribonuclease V [Deltaproteobacteria bacterium]